jgi:methyl-accepting chemotaxis protein
MDLRNWRIGLRLGIGYGVILVLMLATVLLANSLNGASKRNLTGSMEAHLRKSSITSAMRVSLPEAESALREAALLADPETVAKAKEKLAAHLSRYSEAQTALAAAKLTALERQILEELAGAAHSFDEALRKVSSQTPAERGTVLPAASTEEFKKRIATMKSALERLTDQMEQEARTLSDASASADRERGLWLLVACASTLFVGALIAWRTTISITAPLQGAVSIAKRVAAGDLSSQPKVAGRDEVSELLHALKSMNDSLFKIVSEVRRSSDSIGIAAKEIAMGNADLSSRTETQAGSLEETSSSMQDMAAAVKRNADSTESANRLVLSSSEVAAKGSAVVRNVVDMMEVIKKSSQQMSDTITVIDNIAFQTNILALNAAVEAAHSGEEGRGFAVVAAEVRNLAQRSATAATEIKALINDTVEKIDMGGKLAVDAGNAIQEIVSSVNGVANIIGEIAGASREQNTGIQEVNQAVGQMDAMTQQNAALVEEASAAAESLKVQTVALANSVSVFRLDNNQDEAVAMVKRAAELLRTSGRKEALAAFSRPDPQFRNRDLYINAIDLQGNVLAHGDNAKLVGKNMLDVKDADGKLFIKQFVEAATTKGSGWIDYRWLNPVTGIIEEKTTYIENANGIVLGCGIYK